MAACGTGRVKIARLGFTNLDLVTRGFGPVLNHRPIQFKEPIDFHLMFQLWSQTGEPHQLFQVMRESLVCERLIGKVVSPYLFSHACFKRTLLGIEQRDVADRRPARAGNECALAAIDTAGRVRLLDLCGLMDNVPEFSGVL